jgi:hypothetical protein
MGNGRCQRRVVYGKEEELKEACKICSPFISII